jgi:hypothetical protein
MINKAIVGIFVLMVTMFLAAENSFAQGNPCLLGVGNCPQGGGNQGGGNKGGRYVLSPELSADAMKFINYGSRYLLRLSTPYPDPNGSGCNVEIRAWVSAVEANDGNRISVKVGPSRNVLICPGRTTPTVEQVNQSEAWIQHSRNWIAELQTNPTRYPNSPGWINYYTQYIAQQRAYVAQGAP